MQYGLFSSERFFFFCLGSGSCGNCYYLGNSHYGFLIDAGLGPRVIKKRLAEYGIDLSSIYGVLITHDHFDHIKSVGYFGDKLHIPIYATQKVHRALASHPMVKCNLNGSCKQIRKGEPFHIEDFRITAFDVPHDSTDNAGYFFEFDTHKLVLATDVGTITEEMRDYIRRAHHLVIESNYDEKMLQNGRYPYRLKQRIASGAGHLSNRQTAEFLADIYSPNLRNVWLCHLSGDNNCPELAYNTVKDELMRKGIVLGKHISLSVFQRNILSEKINF